MLCKPTPGPRALRGVSPSADLEVMHWRIVGLFAALAIVAALLGRFEQAIASAAIAVAWRY